MPEPESVIVRLRRLVVLVLGTWQPPPWLRAVSRRAGRPLERAVEKVSRRPLTWLLVLILASAVLSFGWKAYRAHSSGRGPALPASGSRRSRR